MSLTQVLNTALAGLQATQTGLSVVAGNIANAQTPDYVRKTVTPVETEAGGDISVRISAINRQLNELLQTQLQTETSGGSYADTLSQLFDQLQNVYGTPGSSTGLDTIFNNFTTAMQGLLASPGSTSAQSNAVNAARVLAQQLNSMSAGIQMLRSAAEQGIASDVATANNALQRIAQINQQVATADPNDGSAAALLDQRDLYVDQLTKLMSIKVVQGDNNQISVYTGNGMQLVGAQAVQLGFDAHGTLSPTAVWSADPSQRSVGTITLTTSSGASTDMISAGVFTSGEIGAYLQMRDQILPQAQSQLDEFAARMAQAASDVTTDGASATAGAQTGFDLDVSGLQNGNTIQLTYTDALNVSHNVTIVRVDDPSALPLSNSVTTDPNDTVVGINFSGNMASVVAQLTAALGSTNLQFSSPGPNMLRILNDAGLTISVDSASITKTMTSLTSGNAQLPLFTDGTKVFSGAITGGGSQMTGFAARIGVNSALIANPANLVAYQTAPPTAVGDPTRPAFLFDQMANAGLTFSPSTGIGGTSTPYTGSLSSYISQVMAIQGQAASNAKNLKQGQDVVVNALQDRLNQESGVNIDTEMTNLLNLQNAYGANARVLSAVKDMFQVLLSM